MDQVIIFLRLKNIEKQNLKLFPGSFKILFKIQLSNNIKKNFVTLKHNKKYNLIPINNKAFANILGADSLHIDLRFVETLELPAIRTFT